RNHARRRLRPRRRRHPLHPGTVRRAMKITRAFVAAITLAIGSATAMGCVGDRPSRNGVFNENQYVRKTFLVRSPTAVDDKGNPIVDPGWSMKTTIPQVSSPNLLGGSLFGIFPGAENGGAYVRFKITQDKLEMVNVREFSSQDPRVVLENNRVPETVNAWPIT